MSTFLTGKELEGKLTDIIWDAKRYIVIISPFIKLDTHIKSVFEKAKRKHKTRLYIVFGKNEEYKHKSFNEEDYEFFKEFKNIAILYNKNLHAKHYCNENEGLITSLNLYGFSMVNNIEYGVHFSKTMLNPLDKLFEETESYTNQLLFEESEVVFLKLPQYSNSMFGLKKEYQESKVIFDVSNQFFNGNKHYESKKLKEFDLEIETSIEKKFDIKPEREEPLPKVEIKKAANKVKIVYKEQQTGYCIRTGVEIPFDPKHPMCKTAWKIWNQFGDEYYQENYCHKTGKASHGKTCMANPIL